MHARECHRYGSLGGLLIPLGRSFGAPPRRGSWLPPCAPAPIGAYAHGLARAPGLPLLQVRLIYSLRKNLDIFKIFNKTVERIRLSWDRIKFVNRLLLKLTSLHCYEFSSKLVDLKAF